MVRRSSTIRSSSGYLLRPTDPRQYRRVDGKTQDAVSTHNISICLDSSQPFEHQPSHAQPWVFVSCAICTTSCSPSDLLRSRSVQVRGETHQSSRHICEPASRPHQVIGRRMSLMVRREQMRQVVGQFPPSFPALSLTPLPTQYEMKRTYLPRYPITPPICPSGISSEPHRDNGFWIARSNFSMASLLVNRGNRYRDLITWGVHERWMRENFRWMDAEACAQVEAQAILDQNPFSRNDDVEMKVQVDSPSTP